MEKRKDRRTINKYNNIDCCFDCVKQFNDNLCEKYCMDQNNCNKNLCKPSSCSSFKRKENKDVINVCKSHRERLLDLLNTLRDDLLVVEMAEQTKPSTRIISIAGGRFHPILPEAKIFIDQMIKNIEEELKE